MCVLLSGRRSLARRYGVWAAPPPPNHAVHVPGGQIMAGGRGACERGNEMRYITPQHIESHRIALYCTTPDPTPPHPTPHHIKPPHPTPPHPTRHHTTPHQTIPAPPSPHRTAPHCTAPRRHHRHATPRHPTPPHPTLLAGAGSQQAEDGGASSPCPPGGRRPYSVWRCHAGGHSPHSL